MSIVLHHAGKVCADRHAGDNPACVLAMRTKQRPLRMLKHIAGQPRIKHGANVAIVQMTASPDDDGLARTDVDRGGALVGVAVLPEAFQPHTGIGVEPWRVARFDSQNPTGELRLANEFIHVAVEYEPDA